MLDSTANAALDFDGVVRSIESAVHIVKGKCQVSPNTALTELLLDSLDVLEVIMHLEADYGRDLAGLDLTKGLHATSTVADLANAFLAAAGAGLR